MSPSGVEYFVQAVPGFGAASGPVMLAKIDGTPTRALLGLVNRLLALGHRTTHWKKYYAFVYRDKPGGPIVAESEHATMREARKAAQAFVESVEGGTLAGS